jgi:hypothetical protein
MIVQGKEKKLISKYNQMVRINSLCSFTPINNYVSINQRISGSHLYRVYFRFLFELLIDV